MLKQILKSPTRFSRKLATVALLSGIFFVISGISPISPAFAQEGGGHSGGKGGGHSGGKGGGGGGHGEDEEGSGHSGASGKGHEGGHGGAKSVENKVLRQSAGGIDARSGGSRPVWAGGGIPEVELGRLNVARSPEHVLNKALTEAHQALQADPNAKPHSPLQNLALYKEALSGQNQWTTEQAAAFLGAAADKNIPITADTVRALNTIMGLPTDNAEGLAQAADQVRIDIKTAHDAGGGESAH